MNNNLLTLAFALMISWSAQAQETVVWASNVYEVSSETGPLQYSAIQALHRPNVFPKGGDSPNAWKPRHDDKEEFIVLAFDTPIRAQQVAIAETENPGAVKAVYAYDSQDREYLLFELSARPLPIETRLLNLFFEMTSYEIEYIKIVLDCAVVPGFNSIDAVGISASNIPINVLINIAPGVNQNLQAERLSTNVNSTYIEHSPILSPDGKTLYFSRQFHPDNVGGVDDNEDIWYSELDEETGEWLPAKNLGPPLNNAGPNFISSVTQDEDGNTTFLLGNRYGKRDRMSVGVSKATMSADGTISKPQNLEIENYYNYSPRVDQFINASNDVMLMSVERDETYGDRDLYVVFQQSDKSWSEPLNVGSDLNTADEEAAPFISDDNTTVYFSSRGHSGHGGLDIYVTKRLDDTWTKWSAPQNLGAAMNTQDDDVYFNMPSSSTHIYFTRGNKEEDTDIFRFNVDEFFTTEEPEPDIIFVTVKGRVLNADTKEPLSTDIIVERLPDGVDVGKTVSQASTGNYQLKLRPGAMYGFLAEKEGFIAVNENVDLNDIDDEQVYEKDLFLAPIKVGMKIVINNIFFDFDKATLKTASYPELERILEFLKSNNIGKIEIGGHTDSVGDDNYNLSLSQRRADAVYTYFRDNGIDADRMESKGYGETEPTVANDTPENRAKNRRVEFKIIE